MTCPSYVHFKIQLVGQNGTWTYVGEGVYFSIFGKIPFELILASSGCYSFYQYSIKY